MSPNPHTAGYGSIWLSSQEHGCDLRNEQNERQDQDLHANKWQEATENIRQRDVWRGH